MTWWCCRKWCAKTRQTKMQQSKRIQILWVRLFLPIHNQVSYSLFNPFGWVLLSRTWVFHSPGDRYVYKCWYKYVIIPRMDSFEQTVSLPFSWIVMFFDYSQQLLMCIFHTSPDGFFWAGGEYSILLDRNVFRLFAAAADIYICFS